jgi:hypothetical protein
MQQGVVVTVVLYAVLVVLGEAVAVRDEGLSHAYMHAGRIAAIGRRVIQL